MNHRMKFFFLGELNECNKFEMGNSGISGLNGCWAATQGIAGSCN